MGQSGGEKVGQSCGKRLGEVEWSGRRRVVGQNGGKW